PRNFVVGNPKSVPFVAETDAGYAVLRGGVRAGALPYGDRKYKVEKLPDALAGLTLLRTRMGHKAVLDGRFAVVVSVDKTCYVLLALDERALAVYRQYGTPGWLQEYAPTGLTVTTDDPLMADAGVGYLVFARKAPAGAIVLGPPGMDVNANAMYFAFFGEQK